MWRCANDIWGYCSGTPQWEREPVESDVKEGMLRDEKCSLAPEQCGNYLSHQEKSAQDIELARELGIHWALNPEEELKKQESIPVRTEKKVVSKAEQKKQLKQMQTSF